VTGIPLAPLVADGPGAQIFADDRWQPWIVDVRDTVFGRKRMSWLWWRR
jgi:hypothetical protein